MASRPGLQFTNTIARELDVEIFNHGYSASGTMELAVAKHLVAIKRPVAAYIIDCIWSGCSNGRVPLSLSLTCGGCCPQI